MKKMMMGLAWVVICVSLVTPSHAVEPRDITATGPQGDLVGTLIPAAKGKPIVLIIPGSGPTDRDGNNALGVTSASYRLLAQALAQLGIGSLRIDKRGLFASKAAIPDPNDVTISAYAEDVHSWIAAARAETGADCLWLLGHSEGGLIALTAAQKTDGVCGVLLVASMGRKAGAILREQLKSNPANAPILPEAFSAIDSLEAGEPVSVEGMSPALIVLFNPSVQGFLIDLMGRDPAALIASLEVPALIVAGGKDLQTPVVDSEALAAAQPEAKLVILPTMNHVLKGVDVDARSANLATYSDSSLPIHPDLVKEIAGFVGGGD